MPQMEQRGDVITVSDELVDAMTLRGWKLSSEQPEPGEVVPGPQLEVKDPGVPRGTKPSEAPAPDPGPTTLDLQEPQPVEANNEDLDLGDEPESDEQEGDPR